MSLNWQPLTKIVLGDITLHIVIKLSNGKTNSWRWLPYKKSAQNTYGKGRWQIATDYGFKNEFLPKVGEFVLSKDYFAEYLVEKD